MIFNKGDVIDLELEKRKRKKRNKFNFSIKKFKKKIIEILNNFYKIKNNQLTI